MTGVCDLSDLPKTLAGKLGQVSGADSAWSVIRQTVLPGLLVPHELGGQGFTAVQTLLLMEQCGYACNDRGALSGLGAHLYACALPIAFFGTPAQHPIVRRLAGGDLVGAHCATELEAGSDVFACKTRVFRTSAGLRLSGQKTYISNAMQAGIYLVLARDERADLAFYVVEKDLSTIVVEPIDMPAGLSNLQLATVTFNETQVGETSRLGGPRDGSLIFSEIMRWERALILAHWLGKMKRLIEDCYRYAQKREQFGSKIGAFQAVSGRIADMWAKLQAARAVSIQAAEMLDKGKRNAAYSCLAKLMISTTSVEIVQAAIQIWGTRGILAEHDLLRLSEYAYSNLSISGTTDMQRNHIFKSLKLEYL